jgi:hypothetical protein
MDERRASAQSEWVILPLSPVQPACHGSQEHWVHGAARLAIFPTQSGEVVAFPCRL